MESGTGWTRRRFVGVAASVTVGAVAASATRNAALAAAYVTVNVKTDCGATGNGVTNDTAAFHAAAQLIQNAGGGTLVIPPGTYIVGRQYHDAGVYPYYRGEDVFSVHDLSFLDIQGTGAVLRLASGLRYGGFNKDTGAPQDAPTGPRNDDDAAHVGSMFDIVHCTAVTITGVELHGNSGGLVIGGTWGDVDRQCRGTGIWMNQCRDVQITGVYAHHHALDGLTIGHRELPPDTPSWATLHRLEDVTSEYNGRQGLSWVGGRGLECRNCAFNHTGRGALKSAPAAGVDIEPTADSFARDGVFIQCEFLDNAGAGLLADTNDGGYSKFVDCTFWGTTYWSLWCARPGLLFQGCNVFGSATRLFGTNNGAGPATRFEHCTFTDAVPPGHSGEVNRRGYLYDADGGGAGASFLSCTFDAHQQGSVWIGTATVTETFSKCAFVHGDAGRANGAIQGRLRGSVVSECTFTESFPAGTTSLYTVALTDVTVQTPTGGAPTHVSGPRVRWGTQLLTGDIPNGSYPS